MWMKTVEKCAWKERQKKEKKMKENNVSPFPSAENQVSRFRRDTRFSKKKGAGEKVEEEKFSPLEGKRKCLSPPPSSSLSSPPSP